MRIGTHMATAFDRDMASLGITQAQFRTLLSLFQEPLSPGELAQRSMLERATVSLMAQKMVAAGWLERLPGPNRRSHRLGLTPDGHELLRNAVPHAVQMARLATANLDPAELHELRRLLEKMEGHLRTCT